MADHPYAEGTAQKRYEQMVIDREPYLRSARRSAKLTLPYLIVPEGHSPGTDLYKPYQSIGARGVNNLASKMLLTLMATPFFRLLPEDDAVNDLIENNAQDELAQIEIALMRQERMIHRDVEASGDRNAAHEAFRHQIVAGNCLVHMDKDGMQVHALDKYVVQRDGSGHMLEFCLKEPFAYDALPSNAKAVVDTMGKQPTAADRQAMVVKTYDLFTHCVRKEKQWYIYQEVCGMKVPGTDGQYPLDKLPWLALRFIRIAGENYGRGHVEEYVGDLLSLEALSQAVVDASEAGAKVIFLVDPAGLTDERTIAEAPNLAVREGREADVTVVQTQKAIDLRVARETMQAIETRLSWAFLLNRAVQRQAERVTAEEIRYMAQELEDALGGVYSLMAQEFQLPYVMRKIDAMRRAGKLPHLPKNSVSPSIVTGFAAIGRTHDRNRLIAFLTDYRAAVGDQAALMSLNPIGVAKRLASADGVDIEGLIKTPEEMAQDQQQQQMSAIADKAVGPIAGGISKNMDQMAQMMQGAPDGGQGQEEG